MINKIFLTMFFMDVDTIFGAGRRYWGWIMKKKKIIGLIALLLAASVVCTACGSSVNMHKHSRSHCDCPSF
jgi:hypothetical protein